MMPHVTEPLSFCFEDLIMVRHFNDMQWRCQMKSGMAVKYQNRYFTVP
jgi:hypothetical protein